MNSIDIIMLPVADRQRAKEFYKQLGFEVIREAPDAHGNEWIQMSLPGSPTTISLNSFQGMICSVDDIQAKVEELRAKGIEVGEIDHTPWGSFAWFSDLDANRWCLQQAPPQRKD